MKVFFHPVTENMKPAAIGKAALALFEKAGGDSAWKKNDFIAMKIHFGEKGNKGHIRPETAGVLAKAFRQKGARPFLTDTNTLYRGQRDNAWNHLMVAYEHGFTFENCGVPVIIADGLKGQNQTRVSIPGEVVTETFLASDFTFCDGIIGLSHMTGHLITGFGATIKNIGMGCAGRGGKLIQHSDVKPTVKAETCTACGTCIRWCPAQAITVSDKAVISHDKCIGCGECFAVCPVHAIKHSWHESADLLQKKMAEHALAAVRGREHKSSYFNFLTHFTKECDCISQEDPIIPDIGILYSTDPVAVDAATLFLLEKEHGKDFLKTLWPDSNPEIQLEHAEKLGMGTRKFELISI